MNGMLKTNSTFYLFMMVINIQEVKFHHKLNVYNNIKY